MPILSPGVLYFPNRRRLRVRIRRLGGYFPYSPLRFHLATVHLPPIPTLEKYRRRHPPLS